MLAVVQMAAAVGVGAWFGGAEAAASGAAGMVAAAMGWSVVVARRTLAVGRLVADAAEEAFWLMGNRGQRHQPER